MIATTLTFLLGFFAALLFALLVAPVVWRRARRLARREFEATIPANMNEIRASFDHVRAEAALQSRRREMDAMAVREKAALERAEAGRVARENAELRSRNRGLGETVAQQESDLKELAAALEAREEAYGRLEGELRETRLDLEQRVDELEELAERFRELAEIAEERKIEIVSLDSRLERLSDDLRSAERRESEKQSAIERLRGEVNTLEGHLQREKAASRKMDDRIVRLTAKLAEQEEQAAAQSNRTDLRVVDGRKEPTRPVSASEAIDAPEQDPADGPREGAASDSPLPQSIARTVREALDLSEHPLAEEDLDEEALRQRISDIAARVVHLTAKAEGAGSPIEEILDADETSPPDESSEARQVSLADRVRRLRHTGSAKDQAAG